MRCWVPLTALVLLSACASTPGEGCVTRRDCASAEVCINGTCQPAGNDAGHDALSPADAGRDTGSLCGQECETELPCEIGVYDCSTDIPVCVRSGLREEGFVCRESTGSCDLSDTCDGVSAGCRDNKADIGEPCQGGFCDGSGECGQCEDGAACDVSPCQRGAIVCSPSGVPSCEFTENLPDGTSCGDLVIGGFGACEWEDTCAETAEQTREVREPLCAEGACVTQVRMESMACNRDREGVSCGNDIMGDWSECSYLSLCDESAERSRTITTQTCADSVCVGTPSSTETESCSRETDGMTCGDPMNGVWGSCVFRGECSIDGTQTRSVTTPTCGSGSCNPMATNESQPCSRDNTMGDACGTPVYGAWGACTFFDCDPNNGTRYRSLTSACTTAEVCDPNATGLELGTCSGDVVGSFCNPRGGGFGTCTAPNTCTPGSPI